MKSFLFLALFLCSFSSQGNAAVYKLGASGGGGPVPINLSGQKKVQVNVKICVDNSECAVEEECVNLRCESVCKEEDVCPAGMYCVPKGDEEPHQFKCVECRINRDCQQGMYCEKDHTCKKIDPCLNAVCSPAAPFCTPEPYKTLPYTCVQCLENAHCPPLGGLTRSCVDGFCLFNVTNNIVPEKQDISE